MKKIIWITTVILSTFSISVNADNHRGAMEFFACSFNEGKDMSDMMKVTEEWQRFADKNFSETYQAGIMSPYLASTGDFPMDFIWVGFSKDQEKLGRVADEWLAKGQKLQAKFDSVAKCDTHSFWTTLERRAFDGMGKPAFLQVRSCTAKDDVVWGQIYRAQTEMMEWFDTNEIGGGNFVWIPRVGDARDSDVTYYDVWATKSLAERGAAVEKMGQLDWGEARGIWGNGSLVECDNPRVWAIQPAGGSNRAN